MRIALALCLAVVAASALAVDPIYRWVDNSGVIHYGTQPPSKDSQPATLPQIQTYSHGATNTALPVSPNDLLAKATPSADIKEVRILTPAKDQTFRDAQGVISVSATVLPSLPEGAGVVFYLDGAAKNAKSSVSTSMTLNGVERGEHTVTVAVVDSAGKELKRALPVTFYVMPPTAH